MNHLVLEPPQVLLLRFVSQMFSCWKFNISAQYLALNSLLLDYHFRCQSQALNIYCQLTKIYMNL